MQMYKVRMYADSTRNAQLYECVDREKATVYWQVNTKVLAVYNTEIFRTYAEAHDYFEKFEEGMI